jgi:hypothetical protein
MPSTKTQDCSVRGATIPGVLIWVLFLGIFSTVASIPAEAQGKVPASDKLRVLFVGNSQTFRNQVYTIIERMSIASRMEKPLEPMRITRGGWTFQRHTELRGEDAPLRVMAQGGWDYVVLQEHSGLMVESPGASLPFAGRLVKAAREAGATPLFYMTWAHRNEPETQAQITRANSQLGSRLSVQVAPAGEAFKLAGNTAPDIQLLSSDGIHATLEGSYLAACVIFSKLYNRSPVGIPLTLPGSGEKVIDIDPKDASRLQKIAWQALRSYKQPYGG